MEGSAGAPEAPLAGAQVDVHLIDGTYELFRHFFAVPSRKASDGSEVGALRGVLGNIVMLLEAGATHVAVATDHVVESFRNDLWPGYKDGSGIEPDLLSQFHPTEDALRLLGVAVWPMIEFEADDGMAAGAAMAADDDRVRQVFICTPDKDLGQCVGGKVVQWDRRADEIIDVAGVEAKFGVRPESIPDYLGLVGDSADGFPGLKGWGAKSTSAMLSHYGHIEDIPDSHDDWEPKVRGAAGLAATLVDERDLALLFRRIATVRTDAPVSDSVDELAWRGPHSGFEDLCHQIGAENAARPGDEPRGVPRRYVSSGGLVQLDHVAGRVEEERLAGGRSRQRHRVFHLHAGVAQLGHGGVDVVHLEGPVLALRRHPVGHLDQVYFAAARRLQPPPVEREVRPIELLHAQDVCIERRRSVHIGAVDRDVMHRPQFHERSLRPHPAPLPPELQHGWLS